MPETVDRKYWIVIASAVNPVVSTMAFNFDSRWKALDLLPSVTVAAVVSLAPLLLPRTQRTEWYAPCMLLQYAIAYFTIGLGNYDIDAFFLLVIAGALLLVPLLIASLYGISAAQRSRQRIAVVLNSISLLVGMMLTIPAAIIGAALADHFQLTEILR